MLGKAKLYSRSRMETKSLRRLFFWRYRLVMERVPFNMARTVVILVSQVRVGLMRLPFRPVPSRAPYLVCPQGE